MNAQEILEIVEKNMDIYFFACRMYNSEELGLGPSSEIEQKGGEDEGSYWYVVQYFIDHNVYIKTVGNYSSYDGVNFYNGYGKEVFPVEKTITVYE